jgi:hypothetical protein
MIWVSVTLGSMRIPSLSQNPVAPVLRQATLLSTELFRMTLKGASAGGIAGWSPSPRMTPMPEKGPLFSATLSRTVLLDDPWIRMPSP